MTDRDENGAGKRIRAFKGFTLLEVLVSLAIMAVAVTLLVQIFSANLRAISLSGDTTAATAVKETRNALRSQLSQDNPKYAEALYHKGTALIRMEQYDEAVRAFDLALARAREIRAYLQAQGWPEPLLADSGNGAHLLYRVDLPADDGGLVAGALAALAFRFTDALVSVDEKNFNPARIWKLYGTVAAKGDATPERPHRLSRLVEGA